MPADAAVPRISGDISLNALAGSPGLKMPLLRTIPTASFAISAGMPSCVSTSGDWASASAGASAIAHTNPRAVRRNGATARRIIEEPRSTECVNRRSKAQARSGLLSARDAGFAVHFLLCAVDAAPVLVFGNGHAALDAHTHAGFDLRLPRKELLEQCHVV